MQVRIKINNVDVTDALLERAWEINDTDGSEIDVVEVELRETSTTLSVEPDHDLIIEDFNDPSTRFFGGIVARVTERTDGLDKIIVVTAQDYKLILDRSAFTLNPRNQSDFQTIQDAFADADVSEIDTTAKVAVGRSNIEELTFRGATLRQLMDTLTEITGFMWDVDPFKNLIYRAEDAKSAAFDLSDDPDNVNSFPYYNFSRDRELGAYNAIEVRGALKMSDDVTVTFDGDGSRKVWHLWQKEGDTAESITQPPEGKDRVVIEKNTGTDGSPVWTAQTVGIEGSPIAAYDVLFNPITLRVQFATAPPNLTNSWRITGRRETPVTALAVAPGVTRVYKKVLTEKNIESVEQAQDVADAFLREVGNKDRISCVTNQDGLEVGTSLLFTNAKHGLNGEVYRVHNIITRLIGGTTAEYRLSLSAHGGSHTFAHILSELRRSGRLGYPSQEAVTNIRRIELAGARGIKIILYPVRQESRGNSGDGYFVKRVEQLNNPSFEDDLSSWTEFKQSGITGDSSHNTDFTGRKAVFGSMGSAKFSITDSTATSLELIRQQIITAAPGEVFSVETWGKIAAGASGFQLRLEMAWLDSGSAVLSTEVETLSSADEMTLMQLLNKTAPASTAQLRLSVGIITTGAGASGTAYHDELQLIKHSSILDHAQQIIAGEWTVTA